MNFRRNLAADEPDINLIPLIDVLLVIVIFLAASTSFTRFSQLSVQLPQAGAPVAQAEAQRLTVTVAADGRYAVNGRAQPPAGVPELAEALRRAASGQQDPSLLIDADAAAPHQSVVRAMEAAGQAGISRIGFSTRARPGEAAR
ncbi:Biopolymer transport protein ExbD [Pigmentiphaga humi]|uniref:Biopolymer transport protein ExbD n=1 Tax=Pigmentiphaga humi TaxID=2478468 RepID=A0A3P4B4V6_9BURK|nr:biopolymer transporter ExbD [Pigmentiphaga humi]VCU71313.1 Biopolymer transport protein ExbD [Pigmentiphaga humi]